MQLDLEGKSFVIGGGTRGLGYAVAKQLIAEGARVLLLARHGDELKHAVDTLGEKALFCQADISDPSSIVNIADMVEQQFVRLDGLLVNAGGPPPGLALEIDDEQWLVAFTLLIVGPIRLLRALIPLMSHGGSIVFITSSSTRQLIPGLDTSNILRPGVAALVKCLAEELGPRIRVNGLAPGRFDTDRVRSLDLLRAEARGLSVEQLRQNVEQDIALRRYGEPAELGRTATFLLSPAASYITGANIQIDGGLVSSIP